MLFKTIICSLLIAGLYPSVNAKSPETEQARLLAFSTVVSIKKSGNIIVTIEDDIEFSRILELYETKVRKDRYTGFTGNKVEIGLDGIMGLKESKRKKRKGPSALLVKHLKENILNKSIFIYCRSPNRFGAIPCRLILNNSDFNSKTISLGISGFNRDISIEEFLSRRYLDNEESAKSERIGVWDHSIDLESWVSTLE